MAQQRWRESYLECRLTQTSSTYKEQWHITIFWAMLVHAHHLRDRLIILMTLIFINSPYCVVHFSAKGRNGIPATPNRVLNQKQQQRKRKKTTTTREAVTTETVATTTTTEKSQENKQSNIRTKHWGRKVGKQNKTNKVPNEDE